MDEEIFIAIGYEVVHGIGELVTATRALIQCLLDFVSVQFDFLYPNHG